MENVNTIADLESMAFWFNQEEIVTHPNLKELSKAHDVSNQFIIEGYWYKVYKPVTFMGSKMKVEVTVQVLGDEMNINEIKAFRDKRNEIYPVKL